MGRLYPCPLRSLCTKEKEGTNLKLMVNKKWEKQKEYIKTKLSEEEPLKFTVNVRLMWRHFLDS